MSENVASSGFFAILKTPFNEDAREEKEEILYDNDTELSLNYEGTLVFSDVRGEEYGLHIGSANTGDKQAFIDKCKENGLEIDEESIRPYNCIWYNGSDSDMSDLTLEKYQKHLG